MAFWKNQYSVFLWLLTCFSEEYCSTLLWFRPKFDALCILIWGRTSSAFFPSNVSGFELCGGISSFSELKIFSGLKLRLRSGCIGWVIIENFIVYESWKCLVQPGWSNCNKQCRSAHDCPLLSFSQALWKAFIKTMTFDWMDVKIHVVQFSLLFFEWFTFIPFL